MSVSPFDSALYAGLLSDQAVAAHFGDNAEIAAMIRVESALAEVQGTLGVIPAEAARQIVDGLAAARVEAERLAAGTASAGVPVPALVAALRAALPPDAAGYLHRGATSQDIADTALVLRLRPVLEILERRLVAVIGRLADLAERHRATVMAARTRWQQATPTSFGLKCALWADPLLRQHERLGGLRGHLLALQFGGAAGNLAALGTAGLPVLKALARALDLRPAVPWHANRDRIAELAGWLASTTGGLGKLGGDLVLLAQSEVAEVRLAAAGGSSAMPQKQNPVGPEVMVALARFNAAQAGALHQAALAGQERDGTAWTLEWLTLPPMVVAAAAALRQAEAVLSGLEPDPARMRDNIEASHGLILAEAASFALSAHMPRDQAQALVKAAAQTARAEGRHLIDCLAEAVDAPLDWVTLRRPEAQLEAAGELIDDICARARALRP